MNILSRRLVRQGKCSIEKFRGQTLIYIPTDIVDKVGEEEVKKVAVDIFSIKNLDTWGHIYRCNEEGACQLEVPSVLRNPNYEYTHDRTEEEINRKIKENPTFIFPHLYEARNLVRRIRRRYNRL